MRWIALHLPLLALEALAATLGPEQRGRPLALLDGARLSAVDALAAALGCRPGMKRATALALAPQLLLGQADAAREAAARLSVAHAALAFTPTVVLQGDDLVLLEVASCLRLFGGFAALVARLRAALAPLRHRLHWGAAPTAFGAALLALDAQDEADPPAPLSPPAPALAALRARLDALPVWRLGPGREHWEALQGMGLKTLADLRALPRAGLARRFGQALLADLDRARGDAPDPRQPITLPPAFEARLELFHRADGSEAVLHGASVLLARLVAWAGGRHARVRAFALRMRHEPRHRADDATPPHTALDVALAEPSNDAAHLQLLLRERLAHCTLAAPTLELQLHCDALVAGTPPSGELFPSRGSAHEGLVRLLERLQARLGAAQVQRLLPVADHRPERATAHPPVDAARWPRLAEATPGVAPMLQLPHLTRPAWLLPAPEPLHERALLPLYEGRPLQVLAGPERIESGWWDGDLVARDYFLALAHDGALAWIFRERIPSTDAGSGWYLHGWFA
jgi:protein ImuB